MRTHLIDPRRIPLCLAVAATTAVTVLATWSSPTVARADDPEPDPVPPPPTRGLVQGRVVDAGHPLADVLVAAIRYGDLDNTGDDVEEASVAVRTDSHGRFALPQFTERYLIKVCDAEPESTDCSADPGVTRFQPTYRGPDGTADSWLRQTRMYAPVAAGRSVGTITAQRSAVLTGTFEGGANQAFRILRRNDSVAGYGYTDENGHYRVELAPGRYRVVADRYAGLIAPAIAPGFRSRLLELSATTPTRLDFRTRAASDLHGRVTQDGNPIEGEALVISDRRGRIVTTVGSDADGRYSIDALRPGRYRLATRSVESERIVTSADVVVQRGVPTRADFELSIGGRLRLTPQDPTGHGWIDVEVRNSAGQVVKSYQGRPTEQGGRVRFTGLADGVYRVFVRRSLEPLVDEIQTDFPWTERSVTIEKANTVDLGPVALDRATTNLTGRLPRGAGIKMTPLPADPSTQPSYVDGPATSQLAMVWETAADPSGRYLLRGVVPGSYAVTVSSARIDDQESSRYTGNVAVRHYTIRVGGTAPTADFTAPKGGILTGRLRYAGSHRPLIAPVGFQVRDRGPEFWPLPTVSKAPAYDLKFRIDRLQAGRTTGRLLDQDVLADLTDKEGHAIVDSLRSSARLTEPGTPYWLSAKTRRATIRLGRITDLGPIDVRVRS